MNDPVIYNVDAPHLFDEPLIVPITDSHRFLYIEETAEDVGLSFTKPHFLGKLRRVLHDGTLARMAESSQEPLYSGDFIVILPCGKLGLIRDSKYFEFELASGGVELMREVEFPEEHLGGFGSLIGVSMIGTSDLALYVDSFKTEARPQGKVRSVDYITDDEYADVETDDNSGELNFREY